MVQGSANFHYLRMCFFLIPLFLASSRIKISIIFTHVLCNILGPKFLSNLKRSNNMQDMNFVCVNSWPRLGLGQLVHWQFPATKGLNLGLIELHDIQGVCIDMNRDIPKVESGGFGLHQKFLWCLIIINININIIKIISIFNCIYKRRFLNLTYFCRLSVLGIPLYTHEYTFYNIK